jgi:ABC-type sugar transport system permease subunit
MILAWLCVFFAPLITIIYFVATSKYRCPKCHSTFVGVKNVNGVFAGQKSGGKSPVMKVILIILGVFLLLIVISMVLLYLPVWR